MHYSEIFALDASNTAQGQTADNHTSGQKTTLDYGMGVFFASPKSFTGEDVAEVHLHGSPFLVKRFLESAVFLGARLANPGEFTQRAFFRGQIDLVQAEAVADLVHAETEAQAAVARRQLEGHLSSAVSELGEPLRDLLAEVEAWIDFPEEELDGLVVEKWVKGADSVVFTFDTMLESYRSGRIYRDGASVVIVGIPNAGKSSLLNAIVGDERAIVTDTAGTTRDSIEEQVSFSGIAIRLWDTAGVIDEDHPDHVPDRIEAIGIAQSWKRAHTADLVIYLVDISQPIEKQIPLLRKVMSFGVPVLAAFNKVDGLSLKAADKYLSDFKLEVPQLKGGGVFISATRYQGIQELEAWVVEKLGGAEGFRRSSVLVCNQRHYDALREARAYLEKFVACLKTGAETELAAFELRSSLSALDEIIGVTQTENILERIFSRFCIGK
jgi:tRNA modification GTPase